MINEEYKTQFETVQPVRKSKAFTDYLDGVTIAVIGFLIVVVLMAYLLEIRLNADLSWKDVGIRSALLYVCTVSINLLVRGLALRKGRRHEKYLKAKEKVDENNELITAGNYASRRIEYCSQWEEQELNTARERVLAEYGISLKDFNTIYIKYTKEELCTLAQFSELTKEQIKAICTAKKIKRLKYDIDYLSVRSTSFLRVSPSSRISTKTVNKAKNVETLIIGLISSVFMVYIGIEATLINDFANVVSCLIKIATIAIFGVVGFVGGYNFALEKEVDELKEKAHEQAAFIKWCEAHPR